MRYPLLAACLGLCVSAQAESLDARIAEGAALIPAFQKHLLETVQGAMRQGGPAQAGEPLASMQRAEVVDGEVRVMKPIVTGAPCLACHGTQVEPQLARLIRERYPDDQATGFREGELRGAFTLRRPVDDEG